MIKKRVKCDRTRNVLNGLTVLLLILFILIQIKNVFWDIDIDEIQLFAEALRLDNGDIFFSDVREASMFSTIFLAALMKPYLHFVGTTGIVIYVRICTSILKCVMASFVIKCIIKMGIKQKWALLLGVSFALYGTKKMNIPDYANLQIWLPVLIFCFIYVVKEQIAEQINIRIVICLILTGVVFDLLVMAYPAYLLLLVAYILGFFVCFSDKKKAFLEMCIIALVCFVGAIILFVYMLHGQNIEELLSNINIMINSSAYTGKFIDKLYFRKPQLISELTILSWFYVGGSILALAPFVCIHKTRKFSKADIISNIMRSAYILCLGYDIYFCCVSGTYWHQRYLFALALWGTVEAITKKEKFILWFGMFPGWLGFLATLYSSRVWIEITYMVLFVPAFFSLCLLLKEYNLEDSDYSKALALPKIDQVLVCIFVVLLIIEKVLMVRTSTEGEKLIFQVEHIRAEYGPFAGIYIKDEEYQYYEEFLKIERLYLQDYDSIMYIGYNNAPYLLKEGKLRVAEPSIIFDDTGVDQEIVNYCENNRMPTVVIFNPIYNMNDKLFVYDCGEILYRWINENYDVVYKSDTAIVYR